MEENSRTSEKDNDYVDDVQRWDILNNFLGKKRWEKDYVKKRHREHIWSEKHKLRKLICSLEVLSAAVNLGGTTYKWHNIHAPPSELEKCKDQGSKKPSYWNKVLVCEYNEVIQ